MGPALVSDGHLCLWQEKGEARGWQGEHVQGPLLPRQERAGSVAGLLWPHPRALAPAASRLSRPHCVFATRLFSSSAGPERCWAWLEPSSRIYFQPPDDRSRAAAGGTTQFSNLSLD